MGPTGVYSSHVQGQQQRGRALPPHTAATSCANGARRLLRGTRCIKPGPRVLQKLRQHQDGPVIFASTIRGQPRRFTYLRPYFQFQVLINTGLTPRRQRQLRTRSNCPLSSLNDHLKGTRGTPLSSNGPQPASAWRQKTAKQANRESWSLYAPTRQGERSASTQRQPGTRLRLTGVGNASP